MTGEQKQQIKILRYQGFGYEKIAKSIGLSRDSVRGYCVRNGLNGLATELVTEYRSIMKEEFQSILCLNCGSKIVQNKSGRRKKYCSLSCKREWENIHRKTYKLTCEYCGAEFKSLGANGRKYCSQKCYIRDRFWREEDVAELTNKIQEYKKVSCLPKWLKDLLLSGT